MLNDGTRLRNIGNRDERRVLHGICGDGFHDCGAALRGRDRGLVGYLIAGLSILVSRHRGHVPVYARRLPQ